VNFKVWGVTGATMLFAIAQAPLLQKHGVKLD
jgi:intracellular septation protein A